MKTIARPKREDVLRVVEVLMDDRDPINYKGRDRLSRELRRRSGLERIIRIIAIQSIGFPFQGRRFIMEGYLPPLPPRNWSKGVRIRARLERLTKEANEEQGERR